MEKAHVDTKVELLKGNEGTTEKKQEQPLIDESLREQPVDEVTGVLDGLKGSENNSDMEETPLEVKKCTCSVSSGY